MIIIVLIFIIVGNASGNLFLESQIALDCDLEFASMAMGLIQTKIEEPNKLRQIEAILSSCNKAPMQKLAEVSVFLLDKGTFPSQVMEDIRLLATTMQTEKKKKLDLIRQMAPRKLDQKVDELSSILLNNSLSGNEKVIWISHVLLELPNEHQKSLQRLFNQEFMLITKPFGGMPDQHSHSLPTLNENILETNRKTVTALKNNDNLLMVSNRNQQENRIIPAIKETPSKIDVRKNDFPFLNQLNTTPSTNNASITFGVPHLEIPPTIYNHNDPGERYIDLMTKNRRPIVGQPPSHSVFGTPILPVIQNNGRPQSVGITNQLKNERTTQSQMDDVDLLNPRTSVLTDAVRLLEQTTSTLPAKISQLMQEKSHQSLISRYSVFPGEFSSYSSANTFPLPQEAYKQIQTANYHRNFLPSRDDSSAIIPINHPTGLDRFDTSLGRFANGPSNRIVISASPPERVFAAATERLKMNNSLPTDRMIKQIETNQPKIMTFTDNRMQLFPQVENHAQLEKNSPKKTSLILNGEVHKNINDQVEGIPSYYPLKNPAQYASGSTIMIENHLSGPNPAYEQLPQRLGDDISATDPLGSIPMGRYGKDYPPYPPPPVQTQSTTVISVIQEPSRALISTTVTYLQSSHHKKIFGFIKDPPPDLNVSPVQSYKNPDEITGSNMIRRIHSATGNNQFVKIDLSNE